MRFPLNTRWGRTKAWLYRMLIEHNLTNAFYPNFYRVSEEAYRSAQPTMWQLRRVVKKYGIKTIINLKGANPRSAYWAFERELCEKLGIKLVDVNIDSRSIPEKERVRRAKEIFETVEYPIWMHCKAGSDRAGIYSTFYQYFRKGIPIEKTNQLRLWPYGHFKYSKAGKIDHFFDSYKAYRKSHPEVGLLEWAENIADRNKMDSEFKPGGLSSFINDFILFRQ